MNEIHLFIIWEKARIKEEEIINNIKENFKILELRYITWPKQSFSKNLTRFYGQNLPSSSKKIQECGDGEFILVIVEDAFPRYKFRFTSKGTKMVNVNVFDAKEMYRYWTGGGSKIHGTNTVKEVAHDLTLLVGLNAEDYTRYYNRTDNQNEFLVSKSQDELFGAHGWKSLEELFYALNNCINYVVLRNYEGMPETVTLGKHGDVDFLCEDIKQMELITNSEVVYKNKFRVRRKVRIAEKELFCDFRFIGDCYYDEKWEKNILDTKVLFKNLFYVPDSVNMFYTLLYHALIQKYYIADDYVKKLTDYGDKIGVQTDYEQRNSLILLLEEFINKNHYSFVEPKDLSVNYNIQNTNQIESVGHKIRQKTYRLLKKLI